jgi:hypothetical protein
VITNCDLPEDRKVKQWKPTKHMFKDSLNAYEGSIMEEKFAASIMH